MQIKTDATRSTARDLQARRIRWQSGISRSLARVIAGHIYGEARS